MIFKFSVKDEYDKPIYKGQKTFEKNSEVDERKCLDTFEDIHSVVFGTDFTDKSIEIDEAIDLSD
jgi:hypothetical protein|tara:strand:- start:120 stop:314 length:195 start_codon:yes stop_codon:yes gene_type:complete